MLFYVPCATRQCNETFCRKSCRVTGLVFILWPDYRPICKMHVKNHPHWFLCKYFFSQWVMFCFFKPWMAWCIAKPCAISDFNKLSLKFLVCHIVCWHRNLSKFVWKFHMLMQCLKKVLSNVSKCAKTMNPITAISGICLGIFKGSHGNRRTASEPTCQLRYSYYSRQQHSPVT